MTAVFIHSAALALVAAGAVCIYVASPRRSSPRGQWRGASLFAAAFLLAAWMVWRLLLESTTAFFTTFVALMPMLIALPGVAALSRRR